MKQLLLSLFLLCGFASMAGTIVVSNGNDKGSGSLRQAIMGAADGDVIQFKGVNTVILTSGELVLSKSLTIDGKGVTIKGNFAPLIKVLIGRKAVLKNIV